MGFLAFTVQFDLVTDSATPYMLAATQYGEAFAKQSLESAVIVSSVTEAALLARSLPMTNATEAVAAFEPHFASFPTLRLVHLVRPLTGLAEGPFGSVIIFRSIDGSIHAGTDAPDCASYGPFGCLREQRVNETDWWPVVEELLPPGNASFPFVGPAADSRWYGPELIDSRVAEGDETKIRWDAAYTRVVKYLATIGGPPDVVKISAAMTTSFDGLADLRRPGPSTEAIICDVNGNVLATASKANQAQVVPTETGLAIQLKDIVALQRSFSDFLTPAVLSEPLPVQQVFGTSVVAVSPLPEPYSHLRVVVASEQSYFEDGLLHLLAMASVALVGSFALAFPVMVIVVIRYLKAVHDHQEELRANVATMGLANKQGRMFGQWWGQEDGEQDNRTERPQTLRRQGTGDLRRQNTGNLGRALSSELHPDLQRQLSMR